MASDPGYQDNLNGRSNPAVRPPEKTNPEPADGNANSTNIFTGFTMVAPNETRRRELQTIAQKGEDDLQRLRGSLRAAVIDEPPETLERQQERARQQEEKRSQQLRLEHLRAAAEGCFLSRHTVAVELRSTEAPRRLGAPEPHDDYFNHGRREESEWWSGVESSGPHLNSEQTLPVPRGQTLQDDPREREVGPGQEQAHHRITNSAFLDRLEARGRPSDASSFRDAEGCESGRSQSPQRPVAHPTPDPPQDDAGWSELATELQSHNEWAVTKLEVRFPEVCRRFLEDILTQCDGDWQQAAALLSETLG
ncbi:unnamed protein product [Merluccius merluccius]